MSSVKKLEKIAKYWVLAVQSKNQKYRGKHANELGMLLGSYDLLTKEDGDWIYYGNEPGLKKYPSVKKELENVL